MSTVVFEDIQKIYSGGFHAIKGVNLNIQDGEFIVIVGPSGCGKSTLLRTVAGLETISSGQIKIDDIVVNQLEPGERDIAMVFQNYALYPHMTVYDNMAYGLRNQGVDKSEIEKRVKEAAKILELHDLLQRKPAALSGGQRQRVAMGRAIVREPKVFLFDEPLSNLDAKLRVQMRLEIKELQQRLGTTSIYVTHDQVEAMTLADRLVVMNGGLPEQIGTPLEVYEQPATSFVAGFIGSPAMNFLSVEKLEGVGVKLPDGSVYESVHSGKTLPEKSILGIRPEHIEVVPKTEGQLTIQLKVIESLGADSLLYGRLSVKGELLTVRVPGKQKFSIGDTVGLKIPSESIHLFDYDTGLRLN